MRNSELVEVRTLEGHADDGAATGWRHGGEVYLTTMGLARRRSRAGLVEIDPAGDPEVEFEGEEDAPGAQERDDSEQIEARDAASEQEDEEEVENG